MSINKFSEKTSIEKLIADIKKKFPVEVALSKNIHIAYANGDDWSVQNIVSILNYKNWNDLSFKDFYDCGATELVGYISPEALLYYLPGLLKCCATELEAGRFWRLHEVSVLMLLPPTPDYKEVWSYFGDGWFDDWGTPHFMKSTEKLIEKSRYLHSSLALEQRACVACYIEIVQSHGVVNADAEFLDLLKKFSDFWRDE